MWTDFAMNKAITRIIKGVNLNSNVVWIMCILFFALITGIAIAEAKWLYLGAVFIPLILYLCIEKPFIFPFGLYVILIPFDQVLALLGAGEGPTLTRLVGLLTILVVFLKGVFEDKLIRPGTASIWWVLFVIYGILTIWWAVKPELVLSNIQTPVSMLVLYLVVASYRIKRSEFITLKWCIIAGGIISAIFVIYAYQRGLVDVKSVRASISLGESSANPNRIAFGLLIPLAVCVEMMLKQNKIMIKSLFGFVCSVIVFSIIVTGSRGCMLGVAAMISVYVLYIKQRISFGIALIVIGIFIMSFLPDLFFARWGESAETGGAGRVDIWYVGWKSLQKYWIMGAGFGNFTVVSAEYSDYSFGFDVSGSAAHNIYLGCFVELGIVGISLFFLAVIKHYLLIGSQYAQHNIDKAMLRAAFFSILVASTFSNTSWDKSFWLVWMMIMMHVNVSKDKSTEQRSSNHVVSSEQFAVSDGQIKY